ncbi:MAG TPA: response regulator [Caulobacteraceae bacterium]|jgi:CheY-like chemotaxis protein
MDRLRILVAEDDALIAMLLDEILAQMGHEVCATESTQAGTVAAAARCSPDLMIVDARLGAGSGVLAVEEILKRGFVPHVFTSGDLAALRELEGRAVVIEKPFLEPQLAHAVTMAMGRRLGRPTLSPKEPD